MLLDSIQKVSVPVWHSDMTLTVLEHIFIFNLRSYDRINKTPAMTEQERISKVTYQNVQRALAEEIMGGGIHGAEAPQSDHKHNSDDEGEIDNPKEKAKAEAEKKDLMEQRRRFEDAAKHVGLSKFNDIDGDRIADSKDSIAENAMLGMPPVSEELWNKEYPDQELENFIQEELYIHDKLLIVDDRAVICGSSNINDRSQLGNHDSELSIVMQDTHTIDSVMNGQPYKAAHHATTLRRMLWREHLGLLPPQQLDATQDRNAQPPGDCDNDTHATGEEKQFDDFVRDPLDDRLWEEWTQRATVNTEVFRELFHADPDDCIRTFKEYDEFLPIEDQSKSGDESEVWWKKQGEFGGRCRDDRSFANVHNTGHLHDPNVSITHVKQQLDRIKGHLVWMPLHFLEDENMAQKGLQLNAITEVIYT